jgi:hypothetical protein
MTFDTVFTAKLIGKSRFWLTETISKRSSSSFATETFFIMLQKALIFNLPVESLQDIVNWLDPFLNVLPARHSPSKRHYLPIFTLRSVCRTFRTLANEMQFWYKEKEFDLMDLIRVPRKVNPGVYDSDDWEEVEITMEEQSDNDIEPGLSPSNGQTSCAMSGKTSTLAFQRYWYLADSHGARTVV